MHVIVWLLVYPRTRFILKNLALSSFCFACFNSAESPHFCIFMWLQTLTACRCSFFFFLYSFPGAPRCCWTLFLSLFLFPILYLICGSIIWFSYIFLVYCCCTYGVSGLVFFHQLLLILLNLFLLIYKALDTIFRNQTSLI